MNKLIFGKKEENKEKKPLIQGLKKGLGKLIIRIAERPFLCSFVLFLLVLTIGGALFYQYILLVQEKEAGSLSPSVLLKEETYHKILQAWQEQDKKFNEADTKTYLDPFKEQPKASAPSGKID